MTANSVSCTGRGGPRGQGLVRRLPSAWRRAEAKPFVLNERTSVFSTLLASFPLGCKIDLFRMSACISEQ